MNSPKTNKMIRSKRDNTMSFWQRLTMNKIQRDLYDALREVDEYRKGKKPLEPAQHAIERWEKLSEEVRRGKQCPKKREAF